MTSSQQDPVDREELVRQLVEGERRWHELPEGIPAHVQAKIRRRALEEMTGVQLENIAAYTLDPVRASTRHAENFIGATQIPMGICGPLKVKGTWVSVEEDLHVPLATSEGALIASINRGCRALREAGGAVVRVEDVGITRAPVFRTLGIDDTRRFLDWVRENDSKIRQVAEATSNHLELLDIKSQTFGSSIYLRFRFRSGDAMGMNMATIACDRVVRDLIEPGTGIPCVALSGNYCVDKKPSAVNFLEGRGKRIYAEVVLDGEILERCLKSNSRSLVEVQYRKNLLGSIAAGSMGFNAHYANVLAAAFVAMGQDVAQVVEGAMGVTCIEPRGDDAVFASVYLPDVPLGVVGGGTALGPQKEALEVIGAVPDPENPGAGAMRLAEILGAMVLAGELSLLAAFTSGDLAGAHEQLGRGAIPDAT